MAKDIFHEQVKVALLKENWEITHDPLTIKIVGLNNFQIDLGIQKVIGIQKKGEKRAIEIKSFLGKSFNYELHNALGQFNNYMVALEEHQSDRVLYLAIPKKIHELFFELQHVKNVIKRFQVNLLVYNPDTQSIVQWILAKNIDK